MITDQSKRPDIKPKKARLVSDWAILQGFMHSKIWAVLFVKPNLAFGRLIFQYLQANNSLLAYGHTSVTRNNHGSMAGGGIIQMLGVCCLVFSLNSTLISWKVFSPLLAWFFLPVLPFFKTADELFNLACVQVESEALLVYLGVFFLTSMMHLGRSWLGFSGDKVTSRGVGYSYLLMDRLLGRYMQVNEFAVYLMESLLIGTIGVLLMVKDVDFYLGAWLVAIELAEIRILLYEKTAQLQTRRLLDT
ncbi:MAG: hypothetical protein JXQ90_18040 [Cyclobacteriaceae bacterium]